MIAFICIYMYMDGCNVINLGGCHVVGQKKLNTSMLVFGIWVDDAF